MLSNYIISNIIIVVSVKNQASEFSVRAIDEFQADDLLKETTRELLSIFRPYSLPDGRRYWHDQIKGMLSTIAIFNGLIPIPEYQVPSLTGRNMNKWQRIDLVWNVFCPSCNKCHPIAAFEIDPSIKKRSFNKLIAFDCEWKVQIGAGISAAEDYDRVQSKLLGTDIDYIVVKSTENYEVFISSARAVLEELMERNLEIVAKIQGE